VLSPLDRLEGRSPADLLRTADDPRTIRFLDGADVVEFIFGLVSEF
jgi:hypothetical protein